MTFIVVSMLSKVEAAVALKLWIYKNRFVHSLVTSWLAGFLIPLFNKRSLF